MTLCSLVSAQQAQTILSLDLNNMVTLGEAVEFCISERLKTSLPGKKFVVFFPSLPSNISLCPKTTLLEYIRRTANIRERNDACISRLFITFIKPHDPVYRHAEQMDQDCSSVLRY